MADVSEAIWCYFR